MSSFIEKPNLPKSRVTSVICGELCRELRDYLSDLGIKQLHIQPNNYIDSAVRYHADMAAIHLGCNRILVDKQQKSLGEKLERDGFEVFCTSKEIKGEYPFDVALNFTVFDNCLIGRTDCGDSELIRLCDGYSKINVKQGYCKCSCTVINENALITDDESVYRTLSSRGAEVLLVSKGDILLPGHGYGFIGGASCKISHSEILFFGDVTKHKDYKKIADFINKHGCTIKYLDFPLTDFGGIIPITEKAP